MAAGMVVAAIGFVMLAMATGPVSVVIASIVFSVGFTPVITLTTGIIVGTAPPERAGAAAAMSETSAELGGALGIALLGSFSAAIYRARMATIDLSALPADTAISAKATLAAAVSASEQLSGTHAETLLDVARGAFEFGFQLTAILAAIASLAAAFLTLKVLRGIKAGVH
jgi:DHA2 family multidrug resistance protein-like MFS transporter